MYFKILQNIHVNVYAWAKYQREKENPAQTLPLKTVTALFSIEY